VNLTRTPLLNRLVRHWKIGCRAYKVESSFGLPNSYLGRLGVAVLPVTPQQPQVSEPINQEIGVHHGPQ
jgi:hypothetical protein